MEKIYCAALLTLVVLTTICDVKSDNIAHHCEKWNTKFEEGQSITIPGQCRQATCVKAKLNSISELECPLFGVYSPRGECYPTKEDLSKPYPDCCSRPVCP